MSPAFASLISPDYITFMTPGGTTYTIGANHPDYDEASDLVREIEQDRQFEDENDDNDGDDTYAYPDSVDHLITRLIEIADPAAMPKEWSEGNVTVRSGEVLHKGLPEHGEAAERIVWLREHGFDAAPLARFMDRLMDNTSYTVVDGLFTFIDDHGLTILPDGRFLAYKNLDEAHAIGKIVSVPRNRVSDGPERFAPGLFVYDIDAMTGRGICDLYHQIVAIEPDDVVAILDKHNGLRVCRYEVVGCYVRPQTSNDLAEPDLEEIEDLPLHPYEGDDVAWGESDDDGMTDEDYVGFTRKLEEMIASADDAAEDSSSVVSTNGNYAAETVARHRTAADEVLVEQTASSEALPDTSPAPKVMPIFRYDPTTGMLRPQGT